MTKPRERTLSFRPGALALAAAGSNASAGGAVSDSDSCAALRSTVLARHGGEAIDVRIVNLAAMRVACIREVGPLCDVRPCFERLFRWAAMIEAPTGRLLTLSFHRPGESPRRWYWKVAVEMFTHQPPPPGIELDAVNGGRHAVYRLVGPHEGIAQAYRRLFQEWLADSGETVAQRPCMELYRNTPGETVPEHLVTDLCLPLRSPPLGQGTRG